MTSNQKHTATPWRWRSWGETISIDGDANSTLGIAHINPKGDFGKGIPSPFDKSNAEFIVRACNAHDKLVEALTEARDYLKVISEDTLSEDIEDFVCNSVEDVEDRLNKALAKAEGGSE